VTGSLGQEVSDLHDRVMELYLLGQRSQEDALKEWQQGLDKATDETIKRNNFDTSKW
jgi:hypothetical protein